MVCVEPVVFVCFVVASDVCFVRFVFVGRIGRCIYGFVFDGFCL